MTDATPARSNRIVRFLQARISPQGYLGLHLTVGMALIILTCWAFSDIAEDFSRTGWLAAMDAQAASGLRQYVSPNLTRLVKAITFLGSVGFVTAATLGVTLMLAWQRSFYRLLMFLFAVLGGSALNIFLKHLFHRQRPVLEDPLVTLSSYGFPSGHTIGTTILCGCLAIFAASAARTRWGRIWPFLVAAIWVAIIGATRIYLGAHYFSDVIGACSAGIAWLAFCWTAVETLRRWRARHVLRVARRQEASS